MKIWLAALAWARYVAWSTAAGSRESRPSALAKQVSFVHALLKD